MTLLFAVVAGAAGFALGGLAAMVPQEIVRRGNAVAFGILTAVFAALAAFAPGAPTRITFVDVVLRVAVAVAAVTAARFAPPAAAIAATALAVAASDHSSLQPVAFAALGAMIALLLSRRRAPLVQGAAGGAVALVALHLEWPRTALAPSAVAVLILAPILVTGFMALPVRARRPVRRAMLATAVIAVVFSGFGLVGALLARSHLRDGVDAARLALTAIRSGDRDQAAIHFREATAAFDDAKSTVGSPWAAPALAVPVLSPQIRAMRVAADTGRDLGRVGGDTARAADISTLQVSGGAVPVDALTALQPPLQRALDSLSHADTAIAGVRSPWLVPPIHDRLTELLGKVQRGRSDAQVAADAASVVPRFLGTGGRRRYFLAVQNPSESRAVGGIIGNYGEVEADHGKLTLTHVGRVGDLNNDGVPPAQRKLVADADFTARYASQTPAQFWENVTMSPDFPSIAGVIRTLYPQSGGRDIDGVISISPAGLAALLRIVGPVTVAGWPEPLNADNAEQILEYDQYVRFTDKSLRLEFLATATDTIWKRLTSMRLPSAKDLVSALAPAVRSKDIVMASFHPDEQALFDRTGASARMAPVRGDYLGVVTQNALGSKLDWFMRRSVDYRVTVDPHTGGLQATLKIVLHNKAPATGLPPYVINGDNPLTAPAGDNRLYLSVYTPWAFTKATIDGHALALQRERELGRNVLSDYIDVLPGAEVTIQIDLAGRLSDPAHYRLDLYHQPTIAGDAVTTSLTADKGGRFGRAPGWTRTSPSVLTRRYDSTADATFTAALG